MAKVHKSAHTVTAQINRPAQELFAYLTTAANWTKWHPATVSVSGDVDHPAVEGETIVEVVRHGLMRDIFPWKIEECRAPNRWAIQAKSKRFGQVVRIEYTLTPEDGGTRWERMMCFYFPQWLAPLDKLVFSRILRKNSEKAVGRLKKSLG
jgi:uncharacterized protein YndB with AHSA1/START domain